MEKLARAPERQIGLFHVFHIWGMIKNEIRCSFL